MPPKRSGKSAPAPGAAGRPGAAASGAWSRDLEALVAGLLATPDTEGTLRGVASFVERHLGAHRCSVILARPELGVGHVVTSLEDASIRNLRIRLDSYPEVVAAIERRAAVCVGRHDGSELAKALEPLFESRGIQSVVVSPLIVRGEVIGAFFVRTPQGGPELGPEHLELLKPLLQVTAVALDEALRRGHLRGLGPEPDALANMRRLVGGLRHFLNNPLTAVLGFTELLLRDRSLPDAARADVEQIQSAAARSRSVMESVADFALGAATGRTAVDVRQVLRDVARDEEAAFRDAEARLHVELPATLPMVWGSAPLLTQALARLIANARQSVTARRGSRQVWLTAEASAGTVRIAVRDDGVGVPHEAREHLFEPFFTTHRSPDRMGLGLAVAHGIVEVHGGSLYLDVGDTAHTTFVIELPITVGGESLTGTSGAITPLPDATPAGR